MLILLNMPIFIPLQKMLHHHHLFKELCSIFILKINTHATGPSVAENTIISRTSKINIVKLVSGVFTSDRIPIIIFIIVIINDPTTF